MGTLLVVQTREDDKDFKYTRVRGAAVKGGLYIQQRHGESDTLKTKYQVRHEKHLMKCTVRPARK